MNGPVPDLLDRAATLERVQAAVAPLRPPPATVDRVLAIAARTPDPSAWRRFLASALLLLGAGLLLSGIVSFFAFNWADMGRLAKMGLIALAIAGSAIAALRDPGALTGRVFLFAASVLVGALLAVFGQAYQTGADPWGLFAVWALLVLPWTLAARFTPSWLLVIALVDVAYVLYVAQVLERDGWDVTLLLGIVAVHVLAVMAWEAQRMRTRPWLDDAWAPRLLVVVALLVLLAPALVVLAYPSWDQRIGAVALVVLSFVVVLIGVFHRLVRPDAFMLTAAAGSVMAVVTTVIGRLLMVTLNLGILGLMVMTGLIVLEVTLAVTWLRRQAQGEAA